MAELLFELEVNASREMLYSLKSILPRGLRIGRMAECFLKRRAKSVQIFKYYCDFDVKRSFEEGFPNGVWEPGEPGSQGPREQENLEAKPRMTGMSGADSSCDFSGNLPESRPARA
jgi:hypothetical protein